MSDSHPSEPLLNERERNCARELWTKLWEAFCWERTPQGKEYWFQVAKNLHALSGDSLNG